MKIIKLSLLMLFVIVCGRSYAVERAELNTAIKIEYGAVMKVSQENIKSNAGKSALIGGMLGAATSGKKDRKTHTVEGAAAFGILAAISEGRRKANSYQVKLNSGGVVKVIAEHGGIRKGDCVSVEQGKTANVRRVSPVYCESAEHEALQHEDVKNETEMDAKLCHDAKDIAMSAKTESELDVALKKVQAFCGH